MALSYIFLCLLIIFQVSEGSVFNFSSGQPSYASNPRCDLFRGSWVVDESYPLYDSLSCPFISQDFDCVKNHRPNTNYQKYRWQPAGCPLPRFNGVDFFERFRGKRILVVGDSLAFSQWQSLTCLLHASEGGSVYTLEEKKPLYVVTFPQRELTITFLWNAFLVDLDTEKIGRVLKPDSIVGADAWRGMDMLIFDSWHHWSYRPPAQEFDYFQIGGKLIKDMDRLKAFEIGMNTWAQWIDSNIDTSKTQVFFQAISPDHYNSREWNQPGSNMCSNQNLPISGSTYPAPEPPALAVVKNVLSHMTKRVDLLDITLLSQLRIDGHPSIYTAPGHIGQDCTHWCIPGVPDTWNQLLYASLS